MKMIRLHSQHKVLIRRTHDAAQLNIKYNLSILVSMTIKNVTSLKLPYQIMTFLYLFIYLLIYLFIHLFIAFLKKNKGNASFMLLPLK